MMEKAKLQYFGNKANIVEALIKTAILLYRGGSAYCIRSKAVNYNSVYNF